jgi:hypothetical protein
MSKRRGKKGNNITDLHDALASHGIDLVAQVADILGNPETSDRIRADLLKELLNYRYSKQKAVQVDLDTAGAVTFNLDLGSRK